MDEEIEEIFVEMQQAEAQRARQEVDMTILPPRGLERNEVGAHE